MDELRSKLFYEQKNGYDLIDTEERLKVEDYCKGYIQFLDNSRMEPSRWLRCRALWNMCPGWHWRPATRSIRTTGARP